MNYITEKRKVFAVRRNLEAALEAAKTIDHKDSRRIWTEILEKAIESTNIELIALQDLIDGQR